MTVRLSFLIAAGLLLASAAPAAADEYKLAPSQSVGFGPLKVRGYTFTGVAVKEKSGPSKGTRLYLSLSKRAKGTGRTATQTHSFTWTSGVKLRVASDLSSATLRAGLGNYGKLRLKFTPTKGLRRAAAQKPCTGSKAKSRVGNVGGTLKFVADKTFFKTIKASRLMANAAITPGRTCQTDPSPPSPPSAQPVSLSTTGAGGLSVFVTENRSGVDHSVSLQERQKDPAINRSLFASTGDRGNFDVAENASSANATGIAPWLTGQLSYTATDYYMGGSQGKIAGNYAIKFDGAGTRRPFAAGDVGGSLSKPGFTPPPPPNQNPTANFTFAEGGGVREITFFDESMDPDGTIVGWTWDFGDGTAGSTQQNPTHVFGAAGTYQVRVSIRDDRGATATVTKSVTVTDPSPGEEP